MTTIPLNGPSDRSANAVSALQFDSIVETFDLAAFHAPSGSEAAWRADRLTLGVHLRQLRLCVIVAIETFKELGGKAGAKAGES